MILEMVTSMTLGLAGTGTIGYSESAAYVREKIRDSFVELQRPEFYFSILKKALPALIELRNSVSEANWDGYGAVPVRAEAFARAYAFLEVLPNHLPVPTIGAEPDGHITFEWYASPHRLLSVSVSPAGDLHYAALIGPNRAHGTEVFYDRIPDSLIDLVRRVTPNE